MPTSHTTTTLSHGTGFNSLKVHLSSCRPLPVPLPPHLIPPSRDLPSRLPSAALLNTTVIPSFLLNVVRLICKKFHLLNNSPIKSRHCSRLPQMDTLQINSILFNDPFTKKYFLGTFPCDKLPSKTPREFSLVVNVDRSDQPGLHWQSVFGRGDDVFFMDSFGNRPQGLILEFCKRFPHVYYNAMAHQKPTATTCGKYSIFHIKQMSHGVPFEDVVNKFVSIREDDKYINSWMRRTYHFNE